MNQEVKLTTTVQWQYAVQWTTVVIWSALQCSAVQCSGTSVIFLHMFIIFDFLLLVLPSAHIYRSSGFSMQYFFYFTWICWSHRATLTKAEASYWAWSIYLLNYFNHKVTRYTALYLIILAKTLLLQIPKTTKIKWNWKLVFLAFSLSTQRRENQPKPPTTDEN